MNGQGTARPVRAKAWRIAVVEDHVLQRNRTEELLNGQGSFQVVFTGEALPELVSWLKTTTTDQRPHVVLLDLVVDRGPNADPETVRNLVRSGIQVLVLSAMASPPLVREMLRSGIAGVVGKRDSEADIVAAVWSVLGRRQWITPELAGVIAGDDRRPRLSDQEERALVLYASGLTLEAVAEELGVKRETAKTYVTRVKAKYAELGRPVRTKVDLARAAVVDGYVDLVAPDDPPGG